MAVETTSPMSNNPIVAGDDLVELSIVMPCLNEAETLALCIEKARQSLRELDVSGEIIIADNGSTDGSQEIAAALGARVIPVAIRGYGSALMGGITAAGPGTSSWVTPTPVTISRRSVRLSRNCAPAMTW
jgi:glycosyltransferase involved in cell wall biosynthesis